MSCLDCLQYHYASLMQSDKAITAHIETARETEEEDISE